MTPQQIADELSPRLRGRVAVDPLTRHLFSTDASPFQLMPAAVVTPLDDDDLRAAVAFAKDTGISIVPRGAGTGLAGESLTAGIVLDLSVHFRSILEISADTVRVQPGVTLRQLNDALAPHGRRFAADPANADVVTLGGMIATNASGGTAFRHGYTGDHVQSLRVVWDSGDIETANDRSVRGELFNDLVTANRAAILAGKPRTAFSRCGYRLDAGLLPLLIGSEGTIAVTAEATLKTAPLVGGTANYALGFASLDDALSASLALRTHEGIAGCDLLDQRLLSLARAAKGVLPVPADVVAALIVTLEADTPAAARDCAAASFDATRRAADVVLAEPASDPGARSHIARLRHEAVYGFYTLTGPRRPEAFVEDFGVPPEALPAFIHAAQAVLRDANLAASFLTHTLTGVVHCRPLVDLSDPADQAKAWPLAETLADLALELGGTLSAQHGVGLARTPWIEKQFGPLLPVYREVKRIFDPDGIFNPGKIVGPDPSRPAWPFRTSSSLISDPNREPRNPIALALSPSFAIEVKKCNACGDCRTRTSPQRMCPTFRVSGDEAATPRGMANTLRAVLEDPARLASDEIHEVAKNCIHCTRCRDECPAGIDIPSLMLDAKAAHYAAHGFDRGEWLIARSERLAVLGGTLAFTSNIILGWRPTRWLLEKFIGLSRRRMLHRFTHRTYLRRRLVQSLFRRESPGTRRIAYFVDTFANVNDPLLAEATVAVLEHHGFSVVVPQKQRGSGMAALMMGDVESARRTAAYNVRTLAELVRDGCTVVASEPTAALALTTEYPRLLNDADSALVAANTVELTTLLAQLQLRNELKPPTRPLPLTVAHHTPCHLKSLGGPHLGILAPIQGLKVHAMEHGCSGAAGAWGLSKANFDLSMQIGESLFAAVEPFELAVSECSACRQQIQQGTRRRALHPVQLLALSYGLVPRLQARFTRPLKERLTG